MVIDVAAHILLEDDFILIINKPAGLMVEPDRNGHPNLLNQVKRYLNTSSSTLQDVYAQHIHRLDRPVSGIVLFAKQRSVLKNLSEQFAERKVKKYYHALTEKAPAISEGNLAHWHRKEKKKAVLYVDEIPFSERASLSYSVTRLTENRFLWNIELHTGKYHQIRAQLAQIGCPILGDILYGSIIPYPDNTIALNAWKLSFRHPVTDVEINIENKIEL